MAIAPAAAYCAETTHTLDAARIAEIASLLPPQAEGPGKPATDRVFWNALAADPSYQAQISHAKPFLTEPLPKQPDSLFLEFSQNGNRTNYENVAFSRRGRLTPLVLAECVQNKGTFLPAINSLINELCRERTWVLPAHDAKLTNFNGSLITVDLFSSNLAWQLAMTDYLLGDKLAPDTRATLRREVKRRVIEPFRAMIRNERKQDWWLTGTNNWNPVCMSGVTGCALIELPAAKDRAEFVAAAEYYSKFFLSGFTPDGYCSEGLGYWNYGFGMYVMMAENLRLTTGGAVDFFKDPGAAAPATYGARISILNGQIPAFADCSLAARPSSMLMWLLNRKYGWDNLAYSQLNTGETLRSLFEAMLYHAAKSDNSPPITGSSISEAAGPRAFFPDSQVYVGRPAAGGTMGVAFKGGNNNESHNHNDLGSYVVVVGNESVLVDPGPETYTRRTFSSHRYESKLLNSFGHAVPVIAGELQRKGEKAQAKILSKSFSATTDTITLDLTSAYDVPRLKRLTRTFEYGRAGAGILMVTDHVEYLKPETFETALISFGKFGTTENGHLVTVQGDKSAAKVIVSASTGFETSREIIDENMKQSIPKPNRLAVKLKGPVTSATVTMLITPADK
jgi:hypothetical protein